MILCDLPPTEPFPPQGACDRCVDTAINECNLAALRALGAVGFQIVHYSYQESKFRVELLGVPAGLCVELSSQEYFRLTQAMEAQQEAQPKEPEVVTTTEEKVTEISPTERTKGPTKGRYLRKMLPILGMKRRSEKESSQIQIRQRIATFMICLLRLFEKKKKPSKAAAATATATAETAKEELKEEPIPSTAVSS